MDAPTQDVVSDDQRQALDVAAESARWLEWLYGPEPLGLIWIGGHGDRFSGRTFTSITEAVEYAGELDAAGAGGVYHRLTTLREIERGRGTAGDSAYLPGFAMDLDLLGPGHKALNYPETEQDLATLLSKAGLPDPTAWVHSGGGRYPFWKLEQPADLTLPGQLQRAAQLSSRLHKHVIGWAGGLGWKVDNTSDLARIYRLPGTINRKVPGAPVLCSVAGVTGDMVTLEQMEQAIVDAPSPEPVAPFATQSEAMESQLFGGGVAYGAQRIFTLEQALEFVRGPLADLRNAQDGEINNRLLAASLTLAHFGPEFWDRDAAEHQLHAALAGTVYDGSTWKAHDTIGRAYADMAGHTGPEWWQATLVRPTLEDPQPTGGRLRRAMLRRSDVEKLPDPVPLIEDVMYASSVLVLSGKFGTYKSFIAVSWAAALATGTDWMGHRVPAPVPVIYAAAEGAYGIRRRLNAWEKATGITIPDSLYLIPISVRLNRPEDMRELEEIIIETRAQVLIFDTLHASTPGVDENDAGEMGHVMDVLRGLQERHGICSILPHHTGHAGERARGSSSVEDDADTTFVVRLNGEDRGPDNIRTLVHRKTKDGPLLPDGELALELVDGTGSGYVSITGDAWTPYEARPKAADHGQEVYVPEPEPWTKVLVSHHNSVNTRRILTVLQHVADERGIREDRAKKIVLSRWYGGRPEAKRADHLDPETWTGSWTRAHALITKSGEKVLSNPGGERFSINPDALSELQQMVTPLSDAE